MLRELLVGLTIFCCTSTVWAQWKPVAGPLATKWAKDVTPEKVHPEYPRPQLVRPKKKWVNLNGLWDYAIAKPGTKPEKFDGQILVPFPIESSLSGVMRRVGPEERLWYRRELEVPLSPGDSVRIVLHFGAVDWHAKVAVNGKPVGEHRGGYDPFSFDITDALDKSKATQELTVEVRDPTDSSFQPRGKQVRKPEGIWYTPTTGIWQTVWFEYVPKIHISELTITPDVDAGSITVGAKVVGAADNQLLWVVIIPGADRNDLGAPGRDGEIFPARESHTFKLKSPRLWSPDAPNLYYVNVVLMEKNEEFSLDQVESYCALRKISLGKDEKGFTRILLNNKFVFQSGLLDQGFWPDGLYTAPTDAAMKYDLEITKKLGFNMVRKHVKVEPARWYRYCDELGLLVWQDMPSGDKYIGPGDPDSERSKESADNFKVEWAEIMRDLAHFPSIMMWVPFNEGWGQFSTREIADFTRKRDPTRLVDSASGWTDRQLGDVHDVHIYPGPGALPPEEKRTIVLGEFGGLGLPLVGHTWQAKDNWGYRSYQTKEELNDAFAAMYDRLPELIAKGLSAAVYTQTTDVEVEVNGLMTYDRAVLKIDPETAQAAHRGLLRRIVRIDDVVATSEKEGQKWRYTTTQPGDGWTKADFDDAKWPVGLGGFGEKSTPGSVVRTEWKSPDIWLRRAVDLEKRDWHRPELRLHWDEDTEVYFNDKLAARTSGYSNDYGRVGLTKAGREELARGGKLTIAVHTHQTGGGQYIDLGVLDVVEEEPPRKPK